MCSLRTLSFAALSLVLASCDGTVSVTFSTGPQVFEVSTASLGLPNELHDTATGTIASVPCGPMGLCPPTIEVTLECVADVCDPAPKTLSAPVGSVIDVDSLLSETREVGLRTVDAYTVEAVTYDIELNTLTMPIGEIEVYWGPRAATSIDPALGVRRFGTVPPIAIGQTGTGQMAIDGGGSGELSDYLVSRGSSIRFFAQTTVDMDPGDPFPDGSVRVSVNATIRAVGSLLD